MQGASKVGLLVVIFVGLLVGAYAFLGQNLFGTQSDTYFIEMHDAGGLTPGTRILLAGVKVGQVTKVELASPTLARLTVSIQKNAYLPTGTKAQTSNTLLALGDTPLILVPGNSPERLKPGSTMVGERANVMDEMLPEVKTTMKELNKTLIEMQKLISETTEIVSDKGTVASLKKLMASTDATIQKFGNLAARLDNVVSDSQQQLKLTITAASGAMQQVERTTKAVADMLSDGKLNDKTLALLDSITKATDEAKQLVTDIRNTINDPEMRQALDETTQNIAKLTETSNRIALDAEKIVKNGVTISENTVELTNKANGLADDASTILKQFQQILGKTPKAPKADIGVDLDLMRTNKPAYIRTDINMNLSLGGNPYHLGLYDAFETNKVNLQAGKFFGNGHELRYGIFASKPGVGVDYALARGLILRGDVYDINKPKFDLRLRYELGDGFYGWAGFDQVLKRNSVLLGVGIRK
jgi:phospholipid/cholesterol/gamma-HCH transport system substrate-binding protein